MTTPQAVELAQARQSLAEYRTKVRARAIQACHDNHLTLDELNETLEHLGLEPYEPRYLARVPVHVEVQLQADMEPDDAATTIRRALTTDAQNVICAAISRIVNGPDDEQFTVLPGVPAVHTGYATSIRID